jgi:pilus assembly protein CpaB
MNRSRLLVLGVISLAIGAFVALYVYRNLQSRSAGNPGPGVDVVVAARDLQVGSKLEDADVRLAKLPAAELPAGIYQRKNQVVGRGIVQPVGRGEYILPTKLAAENGGSGLPTLIPPGMRAVSVRVNDVVAVAGFVVPGTRVDVLLTGNPAGAAEAVTTTVLENVLVLAAGQRLERSASGDPQTVPVITLLVSPDDAQKLTLSSAEGRIQLALRNPLDAGQEKLDSLRRASLYRGTTPVPAAGSRPRVAKATQVPPPPQVYTVEMIRGEKREVTKF